MKISRPYTYILLASASLAASFGCSDEIGLQAPSAGESNEIRFSASMSGTRTRSDILNPFMENVEQREVLPMVVKETNDSMYLHCEILDWGTGLNACPEATRSNMVHSTGGMYGQFNVSAYHYTDDWSASKANYRPNYFYFQGTTGSMEGGYSLDTRRYWPESGKMRFLAYAPYDPSNSGAFKMANVDSVSGPYVHIAIDKNAANHKDLVVAYTQKIDCTGSRTAVPMNFKHALSCVQFVMASDMETCRIKKIVIRNAKYEGDMMFRTNMADESASSADSDATLNNSYAPYDSYVQDITLDLTTDYPGGKEAKADSIVTDENHSFMMFPQVLPDNASVEVTLSRQKSDGSWDDDEVMLGYLSGKHWPAGKIVRYKISNERWWQELQVSSLPSFTPQGGTQNFSITSFDTASDGTRKPIKWTARYEDPNNPGSFISTPPSWYSFPTDNDGAIDPQSVTVTVKANEVDHSINMDDALKSVGSYGTQSNPYNLSTNSTGKTNIGSTANCYIVDRPGWYILPLVYGNAIKDGSDNTDAYRPNTSTGNGALQNFVNCLGNDISSPYILTDCASQKSGITSGSAKVVWQDQQNLVRDANISVDMTAFGGNGGILFEITSDDIKQGNCVIGLQLPGQTDQMMWSWQIWVTPFFRPGLDPLIPETLAVTNISGDIHNMMYVNLGWNSVQPVDIYKERTNRVEFTATTSDGRTLTKYMTVNQAPFVKYWHGSNTYYQWGRKDPFMPFVVSWEQTWYDSTGAERKQNPSAAKWGDGKTALKERILNPGIFHTANDEWALLNNGTWNYRPVNWEMYTNLWDATYSAKPTVNIYDEKAIEPVRVPSRVNVKTVYDPCPPGYKVPPIHTFTGFTNTGNDIGSLVYSPKNWNGTLIQYDYDCNGGITEPYVYLFYTNEDKTEYIACPLTGYRDWRWSDEYQAAGFSYQMGNYGYTWTAGAASDNEGYYLELRKDPGADGTGWIMPLDYFWQLDGLTVRPCHE